MMSVDIRVGDKVLGRLEVVHAHRKKDGKSVYRVAGNRTGLRIAFQVEHRREDGPFKLVERICRRAARMVDEYYSYPKEKAERGLIRGSDIPERYRREFGKFFGVGTVSRLPLRPCPDGCVDVDLKKEEVAYNLGDLEGFLANRRYGFVPVWD